LQNFLQGHSLIPSLPAEVDAAAILIGDVYKQAQKALKILRQEGLRIAVDATERKLDAKIKSAAKAGYPFALFIGEQELEHGRFKLKNLKTGHEEEHSTERIVSLLAARHKTPDEQL
jgi:histidyl-tRNA synthetase